MKSFGQVIKEARTQKGFSIDDLERTTKIKRQFLLAIETQKWDKLPSYPVLQGFIRLIGHALEVNEYKLVATLRRDYPPKALRVDPRPDVSSKLQWNPKYSFVIGALLVIFLVVGYLVFQYLRFISPPTLFVEFPPEGYTAKETTLSVSGKTSQDATVKVNNQPFVVDDNGKFSGEIELTGDTYEVVVSATSRSGRETTVRRKIVVDLEK